MSTYNTILKYLQYRNHNADDNIIYKKYLHRGSNHVYKPWCTNHVGR